MAGYYFRDGPLPNKPHEPRRCTSCGMKFDRMPKGSGICLACKVRQDEPQREQRYILEDSPVETLGAITSRQEKPR